MLWFTRGCDSCILFSVFFVMVLRETGKLEDVAFGIKKLQMICTIVDHLVSADGIEEGIMQFEDEVQSVDIAAWNKI